uniref:Uncharacterized protein n=1 Tax=Anopheles dirus TaxID=7168 RepID=A0A182NJD0_9DIPT
MAALFGRSLFVLACALVAGSEAGLAASYLAAPVAATYAAPIVPVAQGVLRSAYSQVVGRSYAPSFVPVATSLAYAAAPVVKAVPTVYAAPQQLVVGPVQKTVRPYAVAAPLSYAAPAVAPAAVYAPSVLSTRLAPLQPAVGVAPALAPAAPAASPLPAVFDARAVAAAPANVQRAFVTAFGSPQGIRLVGGAGTAYEGVATNVEVARAAPAGPDGVVAGGRSATPEGAPAASTPETFGVPPQTPFTEYGLPAPGAAAPVIP